ncbi:MAG: hypothetical protein ACK5FS_09400, partial [Planctomycetota bacterium]
EPSSQSMFMSCGHLQFRSYGKPRRAERKIPSSDAKPRRAPNLIQVDGSNDANATPMAARATWPRR